MFECVAGLRDFGAQDCYGCILADDMGCELLPCGVGCCLS